MCDLVGYLRALLQRLDHAATEQSSRQTMDQALASQAVPVWKKYRAQTSKTEPTKAL